MNSSRLRGSARNADFWASATISITMPRAQTTMPTTVSHPIGAREEASALIAIQAAAAVSDTHAPWITHTCRNRSGDPLIWSKRPSDPALCTRRARNEPRRAAHSMTIAARIQLRGSGIGASRTSAAEITKNVRLPVRSKNRSVCSSIAGMNAMTWIAKAAATARANTGTPPMVAPPWLPAIATSAPTTRATTIAMREEREEVGRVGVGEDMVCFPILRGTGLRRRRRRDPARRSASASWWG